MARLMFPGGLDRIRDKDAPALKEAFALDGDLPSLELAEAVWDALVELGGDLPEGDRPQPMRPWQGAALRLFIIHSHASLQGARQGAGKTFVAALVIACHLLLGSSVTVAMPTYRQAGSILVRRVRLFMQLLGPELHFKCTTCNQDETAWDNGARLSVLTTGSGGRRGTQGWTSRVVVIDESQDLKWEDLAWFMPLVALAMKQKRGRMLMLGVGASDLAAPAMARRHPGYASLVLDDATISELDRMRRAQLPPGHPELREDSWADFFAAERELWDEDKYRQFYMCQAPGSGQRKVFDRVPEMVDVDTFGTAGRMPAYGATLGKDGPLGASDLHFSTSNSLPGYSLQGRHISGLAVRSSELQYFLGVDVGKQVDQTVVAILEQLGQSYNLVDCIRLPLGMSYIEQARELAALARAWGCPPGRFAVEVNGPGMALYDVLTDPSSPAVWNAVPVAMTTPRKQRAVQLLNADARHGLFGVAEIPLKGSRVADSRPVAAGAPPVDLHASGASHFGEDGRAEVYSSTMNENSRLVARSLTGGAPALPMTLYRGPTIRQHLAALSQFSTHDGAVTYEHSDILSALLVARTSMDVAGSV
jgi:hypothetical protein